MWKTPPFLLEIVLAPMQPPDLIEPCAYIPDTPQNVSIFLCAADLFFRRFSMQPAPPVQANAHPQAALVPLI